MYIRVKLLQGYQEQLLYSAPDEWTTNNLVGSIVQVPLRTSIVPAIIVEVCTDKPNTSFAIRQACSYEPFPQDEHYIPFIKQLAHYHQVDELYCIKRIRQFLIQKETPQEYAVTSQNSGDTHTNVQLTEQQQTIVDAITPHIHNPTYSPTLIHGVTGSGKTEVYKKLIIEAINTGKSTILLLPEVTLALQFYKLMRNQLPSSIAIASFHSACPIKEKKQAWQMIIQKKPLLLIGVHLPIMLPIANLGLIIVDEEHESGYQEKKHPKINSKEAAIWRASLYGIPIILGSATPSIATMHNVKTRNWKLFLLTQRYAGAFPTVKTVFLTNKQKRPNFWISNELQRAIADRLAKKEQVIIFINRRGFSFFIQCANCSFIPACNACSVSLTLHEEGYLSCHYCGYTVPLPTTCSSCKAGPEALLKRGIGTQQVVRILEKLFPRARIARADLDTTSKKKLWQQTLSDFENGLSDILVGTQTITKGFHFPRVTLAGILWADVNLHFPLYNSSESTLQQLIQVAGRAGRQHKESLVIVQAMADHAIFSYLNETDYNSFYDYEIEGRRELGYPPFKRLVEIELKNTDEKQVELDAHHLAAALSAQQGADISILGPAKPPVSKINHIHTRKIYVKGTHINDILRLLQIRTTLKIKSTVHLTPNPLH